MRVSRAIKKFVLAPYESKAKKKFVLGFSGSFHARHSGAGEFTENAYLHSSKTWPHQLEEARHSAPL